VRILRTALGDLQDGFQTELQNALSQLRDGTSEALLGAFTNFFSKRVSERTVCDQRVLLHSSYSSPLRLPPLISVWDHHWFPRFANTNRRSTDKSLAELLYSTRSCRPSKTVQRLYKKTPKGKLYHFLRLLDQDLWCVARKLTEKLREAYAPLTEDCCKAILDAASSHIAKLNSGSGTFL
jgi:hypothetical protein